MSRSRKVEGRHFLYVSELLSQFSGDYFGGLGVLRG